jgi:hypothetical protein
VDIAAHRGRRRERRRDSHYQATHLSRVLTLADYVKVLPIDPSLLTGAVTVAGIFLKGYFEDRKHKRRFDTLAQKVDENTAVNVEQIKVSNHVNEKIADTNTVAADGLATLRGEVADIGQKVEFYTEVTQELAGIVSVNTKKLDTLLSKRAA